jgi:signal peptidase I
MEAARRRLARRMIMLAIVLLSVTVAAPFANGLSPTRGFAVASGSMEPELSVGTLVFTERGPIEVGDVVVYWSPIGSHQVHRVVEIVEGPDGVRYRTAGDASEARDSFLVPAEDVQGRVVRDVPHVGHLWLLPGWLQASLFLGAVFLYLVFAAWEARALLRTRLRRLWARLPWFRVALLVLLLTLPGVLAVPNVVFPPSQTSLATGAPSPVPLAAGSMGNADVHASANRATVTVDAPKLWREVAMWHCPTTASGCSIPFRGGNYHSQFDSILHLDLGDYSPAPTFYLEGLIAAPAGETAFVILRRGSSEIAESEISTTSTSPVLVRSPGFTLTGSSEYVIRTRTTGPSNLADGAIVMVKLILAQDRPTDTSTQIRLAGGSTTSSTSYVVPSRAVKWTYEGTRMDGVRAAHFEAVVKVSSDVLGTSDVRLMDRTTNTQVARLDVPISFTAETRLRSGDIKGSLVAGREYEVEFRRGTSTLSSSLHLHSARVIIDQSGFTETLRYVDLSLSQSTSTSTFSTVGHVGAYHMATEAGGRGAWLEATARRVTGSVAVRAFDTLANAPVAGSDLSSTSGSFVRLRSAEFLLNPREAEYRVQIAAPTGSAEIRGAWLIVPQGPAKTFDHVLQSENDVLDTCTWLFTLHAISMTGTARLREAKVSLRGDAGLEEQIVVTDGALTRSSGAPVSVPYSGMAQHVVVSDPSSTGTSTAIAQVRGTCSGSGIHTVQPVTYVFT